MSKDFSPADMRDIQNKFVQATSNVETERTAAAAEIAKSIEVPIREVLLSGNIINGIFTSHDFTSNPNVIFPLDLLVPGDEQEFYAYVAPDHGRIPERRVESDYLMIPTYGIASSIDCTRRFIRDANWPVIKRMIEILEAGVVKKMNDDGWQTILAAATDRNVIISDPNAVQGQFTPQLVTLLANYIRRNGGGNSATMNRTKLTDLFISPEAHMDVRSWGLDLIPDSVRANIYYSKDGSQDLINIFGVNIHALDELGVGQEYQQYFSQVLGGSLTATSDVEIGVGLDLTKKESVFVMPERESFTVYEDNTLFRQGLFGIFGRGEFGFSVLDSRKVILASL